MNLNKLQSQRLNSLKATSNKIRYLRVEFPDVSQGQIAKHLGKRPQHISNVLRTPVLNPTEDISFKK